MKPTMATTLFVAWAAAAWAAGGEDYSVLVSGAPVPVEQFRKISYASFTQSGPVQVVVRVSEPVASCSVSPVTYHIQTAKGEREVRFPLESPRKLMLKVNNLPPLFLLPEARATNIPKPGDPGVINLKDWGADSSGRKLCTSAIQEAINRVPRHGTLLVPAGIYLTGTIALKSDMTLYLAAGAVLQGSPDRKDYPVDEGRTEADHVNDPKHFTNHGERMTYSRLLLVDGAQNVRIAGHGVIDGNGARVRGQGKPANLICLRNSKDLVIKDVLLRDAAAWTVHILGCDNVLVQNVKILNDLEVGNTDGFDPDSSRHVTIENCFAYCGDDTVAIKASNNSGILRNVEDINVRSNVFWTLKSALKVGTETKATQLENIAFEYNEVLSADRGMSLYCPDGALFRDVRFIGNSFEACSMDNRRRLIDFTVTKRDGLGAIRNVLIKDCVLHKPWPNKGTIRGLSPTNQVSHVRFVNFRIAGKLCRSPDEAQLGPTAFAETISFTAAE
jgi:hypothetical protein